MKFKIKDVDIATGGTLVAILNKTDAQALELYVGDRLKISRGRRSTVAVLDIAENSKLVKPGEVGLMEEVLNTLSAKNKDHVNVVIEKKPISVALIKKKLQGKRLDDKDIKTIIEDVVANRLTSVEITYFIAASYTQGMCLEETVALTKAMIETGDILKIDSEHVVDKHCIGGVAANRTTMISVPILVAAGYTVPKTSSRSITSPAGTADTMEVLADVELTIDRIERVVKSTGGCMAWGGAVNLAPADDKFITVEQPLSIDADSQLLASILAKKGSVSAKKILIDIPVGKGAKISDMKKARHLKRLFNITGKRLGMKMHTVITDGSQPIGNGIGPALEARDTLWTLAGHPSAPKDLADKSIFLAGEMMRMNPLPGNSKKDAHKYARALLESGKAYEVMKKIIAAQGKRVDDPSKIRLGRFTHQILAWKDGTISSLSNSGISRIAKIAGAPHDKGAGIYLHKHVGDAVKKNEPIYTIYSESKNKLGFAKDCTKSNDGVEIR